jgi:putative salt-induced outer membrane protein YdiY
MKKAVPFALACLWASQACAIVNVENMRVGTPEPGYSGNIDLSISGNNGNTNTSDVALDGRLEHYRDKVTDFVVVSYDYGESNNQRNANSSFAHGRHIVQYRPRRAWEAYVQAERDEFTRLSFRGLLGAGLRFTLAEQPDRIGLYLGAGGYYTRETLEYRPGLTDDGTDNYGRASFYLSYKHKVNPQVSVISTTYYQPRLGDSGDFRALEQASLGVKMNDHLSLKLSLDVRHDSRPPQTVKKTDVSYHTGLSYQF